MKRFFMNMNIAPLVVGLNLLFLQVVEGYVGVLVSVFPDFYQGHSSVSIEGVAQSVGCQDFYSVRFHQGVFVQVSAHEGAYIVFLEEIHVFCAHGLGVVEVFFLFIHAGVDQWDVREYHPHAAFPGFLQFLFQPGVLLVFSFRFSLVEEGGIYADEGTAVVAETETVFPVMPLVETEKFGCGFADVVVAGNEVNLDFFVDLLDVLHENVGIRVVQQSVGHVACADDETGLQFVDNSHGAV